MEMRAARPRRPIPVNEAKGGSLGMDPVEKRPPRGNLAGFFCREELVVTILMILPPFSAGRSCSSQPVKKWI
jgi:hypothetical protein